MRKIKQCPTGGYYRTVTLYGGSSLCFAIPREYVDSFGLEAGEEVIVKFEGEKLTVEKAVR